ncbi:MAG: antirestriction protein ArdA [Gordonia sp. (in: high G+C Gram-positive bacteria)]|uniref:antirestriction protein ArdA n=1 Tax=Gordonia sp. (in: high G+C Gram-positive bacteria) TaxID=84139 RepID=UPI0039E615CC
MKKHHDTHPEPAEPEREPQPLRPRIYVASLADYNNGRLHGRWIDATTDTETVSSEIAAILATSPEPDAEEFAIHDYDEFGSLRLDEYEQIDDVVTTAKLIAEHGEAYATYTQHVGIDEASEEDFTNRYAGNYPSIEAFIDAFHHRLGMGRRTRKTPDNIIHRKPPGHRPPVAHRTGENRVGDSRTRRRHDRHFHPLKMLLLNEISLHICTNSRKIEKERNGK